MMQFDTQERNEFRRNLRYVRLATSGVSIDHVHRFFSPPGIVRHHSSAWIGSDEVEVRGIDDNKNCMFNIYIWIVKNNLSSPESSEFMIIESQM